MSVEELNSLLKSLKGGKKRIERMRVCIRRLEEGKSKLASKERARFDSEFEKYLRLEDRLYEVMGEVLNEEERCLLISYYIQGLSADKVAIEMFVDRSTVYRWLGKVKEKIVEKW